MKSAAHKAGQMAKSGANKLGSARQKLASRPKPDMSSLRNSAAGAVGKFANSAKRFGNDVKSAYNQGRNSALANESYLREDKKPLWYGIPGIEFIYINDNTDPLLRYRGKIIDSYDVEDAMWDMFNSDDRKDDYDTFNDYMRDNVDMVYEFCDNAPFTSVAYSEGRNSTSANESYLRESMRKYTKSQLADIVRKGWAEDISDYDFNQMDDFLMKHNLDKIGYSSGKYGINGGLLQDKDTGDWYAIVGRNSALFQAF